MSTVYDIGVLPGDGIGSEVVKEALKVLDAIEQVYGFSTKREVMPYGAEHFLKTGEMMPDAGVRRVASEWLRVALSLPFSPLQRPWVPLSLQPHQATPNGLPQ